jgi:hypothetical protein
MKRTGRQTAVLAALALLLAGLPFVSSCVIGGVGEGVFNLLVTDAPQDDWREVSVRLESIQVFKRSNDVWEEVWAVDPGDPESGEIELVSLAGAAAILASATIPAGTYDRIKLAIDPDPAAMRLVDADGLTIPPGDIIFTNPDGTGEIVAELDPPVSLSKNETENVLVDFDLAHPLSIARVDDKVVLNFQVRRKALPAEIEELTVAPTLGELASAAADGSGVTVRTSRGVEIAFDVDPATSYYDADAEDAGSFGDLASLAGAGAVLVDSSLAADGAHYAWSVWYAVDAATLSWSAPGGLVRQTAADRFVVSRSGVAETIVVDADTLWAFRGIDMGAGPGILSFIDPGFRVEISLVDPWASPRVAAFVDVVHASTDGIVASAGPQSFVFGDSTDSDILVYSAIAGHAFEWAFDAVGGSTSTSITDFVETVGKASDAGFSLAGRASLRWDDEDTRWVVDELLLVPVRLRDLTRITTGYTAASGTMILATTDPWDGVAPVSLTVHLDPSGDLATQIGSLVVDGGSGAVTYAFPVPAGDWASLLVPELGKALISLRADIATDGTLTWHVYTVLAKDVL